MNRCFVNSAIRFSVVIVLLGWASRATAVPKPPVPPTSHDHAAEVTVTNNLGDSILGDGGVYTDGVAGTAARIWDFGPLAADHLHFQVEEKFAGRVLRLVIPEAGVDTVCKVSRLKPNESPIGFQFYNDPAFPVGDSTSGSETVMRVNTPCAPRIVVSVSRVWMSSSARVSKLETPVANGSVTSVSTYTL